MFIPKARFCISLLKISRVRADKVKTMIKNPINMPLDIIILAGQSNAQGFGLGGVRAPYAEDENILMLKCESAPTYVKDEQDRDVFICPETDYFIESAKEECSEDGERIGCIALPFAAEYVGSRLSQGRRLLIIKMGIGGTGFAHKQWGIGECLFERMMDMTRKALEMNKDNRVVAMLWHQGECDSFERPELSAAERESIHHENLLRLALAVREEFGNMPFIAGGFCEEWASKYRQETDAVMSAIRAVCREMGDADFVPASDLPSNNQDTANGDDIHFCRSSIYTLAERYYKAYECIKNK